MVKEKKHRRYLFIYQLVLFVVFVLWWIYWGVISHSDREVFSLPLWFFMSTVVSFFILLIALIPYLILERFFISREKKDALD